MKFTKSILFLVAIGATCILASCKHSKTTSPEVNPVQKAVEFDAYAVQKNMAHRVNAILAAKQDEKAKASKEPVEDILIGPDSILIHEVQPVQLGNMVLFGIKLSVKDASKLGVPQNATFVTDPTGTLMMPFVGAIATGKDVVFPEQGKSQVAEPEHIPDEMTSLLFKGTGKADVVFLTDPFCFYCRKGFDYLMSNKDKIGTLRIVHMPSPGSPGADAASWILAYAIDKGMDAQAVFEFTYYVLSMPTAANSPKEAGVMVIKQIRQAFPKLFSGSDEEVFKLLASKYALKMANGSQQLQQIGFVATPYFQVDGKVLRGLDVKGLNTALGE